VYCSTIRPVDLGDNLDEKMMIYYNIMEKENVTILFHNNKNNKSKKNDAYRGASIRKTILQDKTKEREHNNNNNNNNKLLIGRDLLFEKRAEVVQLRSHVINAGILRVDSVFETLHALAKAFGDLIIVLVLIHAGIGGSNKIERPTNRKPSNIAAVVALLDVVFRPGKLGFVLGEHIHNVKEVVPLIMVPLDMFRPKAAAVLVEYFPLNAADKAHRGHILHLFVVLLSQRRKGVDNDTKDDIETNDNHQEEVQKVEQKFRNPQLTLDVDSVGKFSQPTTINQPLIQRRHQTDNGGGTHGIVVVVGPERGEKVKSKHRKDVNHEKQKNEC